MGTRSITRVFDGDQQIMCMYRHMDGYPKGGHGQELAEFLAPFKVVNGIGLHDDGRKIANGAGCLAAQMVCHFKGGEPGGIYVQAPRKTPDWEDYVYDVVVGEAQLPIQIKVWATTWNAKKQCPVMGKKPLFVGTVEAMLVWIAAGADENTQAA